MKIQNFAWQIKLTKIFSVKVFRTVFLYTVVCVILIPYRLVGSYKEDNTIYPSRADSTSSQLICMSTKESTIIINKLLGSYMFRHQMCHSQGACLVTLLNYISTRVVPKVMSNFFFECELGTADEGECGGRWNQLLCFP